MRNDIHPSKFASVTPGTSPVDLVAIYVGVSGNLVVAGEDGNQVTFNSVPSGTTIWGHFILVAGATTASDLVGYVA